MVDADDVEGRPVDGLEREGRIGQRAAADCPGGCGRPGEPGVKRRVVRARLQPVAGGGAPEAFPNAAAGYDAPHEQGQFRAQDERHPRGVPAAEGFGGGRRREEGLKRLLRRPLPDGGGVPHLQAEAQGHLRHGCQPVEVGAAHPYGVAVQVVADDLQLPAGHGEVEPLPRVHVPRQAGQDGAHVIDHATPVHRPRPLRAGASGGPGTLSCGLPAPAPAEPTAA